MSYTYTMYFEHNQTYPPFLPLTFPGPLTHRPHSRLPSSSFTFDNSRNPVCDIHIDTGVGHYSSMVAHTPEGNWIDSFLSSINCQKLLNFRWGSWAPPLHVLNFSSSSSEKPFLLMPFPVRVWITSPWVLGFQECWLIYYFLSKRKTKQI